MQPLQDTNVLVLGLGSSGLAMARWCARQGAASVTVADTRETPPQLAALRAAVPDARFVHGALDAALLQPVRADLLLKSPGLTPAQVAAVVEATRADGIPVAGELDLFTQALAGLRDTQAYAPQILAVTGTNGKTTVASLTAQLVERAGKTVALAGNIGPTLLDTLVQHLDDDTLPVHAARPDGRFAAQLGEALAVLHALAPEAGFADTRAEVDIAHLHAMAADLAGIAGPAAVAAIEEDLAGLDRPGAAVPSHGDINSTNLLVDEEGNLSGLIDWAEARRDRREGEFCHLVLMPQVLAPVRRAYERATGVPLDERALALAGLHNALIGIVICRRIGEIEEADWNVGEARRLTAKLGLNEPATD